MKIIFPLQNSSGRRITMEFSNSVPFGSSNCCTWSPNGRFLAVISSKCRLVLRDAATLDVLRTEVIVTGTGNGRDHDEAVDVISFSPDSQFIFATMFKIGLTFVFKVATDKESSTWRARIAEGLGGITDIHWSPDSRHIISMAEFNVKLTVWSLIQRKVRYIKFPKKKECVAFSPGKLYILYKIV
jgi:WD40 repeat protein